VRTGASPAPGAPDPTRPRQVGDRPPVLAAFVSTISVDHVRRSFLAALVGVALVAGACSTPVYTSGRAVSDLEVKANLTHTQATCIIDAIRKHFEDEIKAAQKANGGSAIPKNDLKLQVDGALAALKEPTGIDEDATRTAILRCAPGARS
jgi:hypothetical protein